MNVLDIMMVVMFAQMVIIMTVVLNAIAQEPYIQGIVVIVEILYQDQHVLLLNLQRQYTVVHMVEHYLVHFA
jgi:hypothetical protein